MSSDGLDGEALAPDSGDFFYTDSPALPLAKSGVPSAAARIMRQGREALSQANARLSEAYENHGTKNPITPFMANPDSDWEHDEIQYMRKENELKREKTDQFINKIAPDPVSLKGVIHHARNKPPSSKRPSALAIFKRSVQVGCAKGLLTTSIMAPLETGKALGETPQNAPLIQHEHLEPKYVRTKYRHAKKRDRQRDNPIGGSLPPPDEDDLSHTERYIKELKENNGIVVQIER